MIQKIENARRIRYKGEEMYVMVKNNANLFFSKLNFIKEDYPDDALIIINGVAESKHDIIASSDELNNIMLMASFDYNELIPDTQVEWMPYKFSPLLVTFADMVYIFSDLVEDDYNKFLVNAEKFSTDFFSNFIEYVYVSMSVQNYLLMHIAVNILNDGLSDYSEAFGDNYYETTVFSEWGLGEENILCPCEQHNLCNEITKPCQFLSKCAGDYFGKQDEIRDILPSRLKYSHKNFKQIMYAIKSPKWRGVPYIKLITEKGKFPT